MFGAAKFRSFLPHPGYNKKDSEPPDYGPLAEASKEAAQIMADLGNNQLDFSKQQYSDLKPLFEQIVNQQMSISDATKAQGDDYYNYLKSFRPVEQQMLTEAMGDPAAREAALAARKTVDESDMAVLAGQDTDIYNQYKNQVDTGVDRAVADTQGGYTRAVNQAIRQGLRYGAGTNNIISNVGSMGLSQAQNVAAAANAARQMGIEQQRGLAQARLGGRAQIQATQDQQRAIDWAKRLDAAGLVKGMPGASQGAYGLAVNAGNAAGHNAMAPGSQYVAGMGQAANTIGSGQQMQISGLSNVLNSQTSVYNTNRQSDSEMGGAILGGVMSAATKFI